MCIKHKVTGVSYVFFHALPPQSTGNNAGNTRDFMLFFPDEVYPFMKQVKKKICGSYHSKNIVLGLKKPLLEKRYRGLKQSYLSGMTQIFFKKSVHKVLNYICEFFC